MRDVPVTRNLSTERRCPSALPKYSHGELIILRKVSSLEMRDTFEKVFG